MAGISTEEQVLLLQFNITQTLQIRLTKLKVYTYSSKESKPHKCHLCKYSSKYKSHLKGHLQTHTGEKPFACTLCNYKFIQRSNLLNHIRIHTGEKPYKCAFCTKLFTTNGHTTRHENVCKLNPRQTDQHWVEMQKTAKCQLCPYSTATKYNLKLHMRTHTGEKPFACNFCNKMLSSGTNLRSHICTHTRERPHSCQFCKRGFAQDATQKGHEKFCKLNPKQSDAKWVEEQKKFKCQLCVYSTAISSNLQQHMMTHTGEKSFQCNLCNNKFRSRGNLQKHIFTHTREKPHVCKFCTRGFPNAISQKNHDKICKLNPKQADKKWVGEKKKFKCHFCQL